MFVIKSFQNPKVDANSAAEDSALENPNDVLDDSDFQYRNYDGTIEAYPAPSSRLTSPEDTTDDGAGDDLFVSPSTVNNQTNSIGDVAEAETFSAPALSNWSGLYSDNSVLAAAVDPATQLVELNESSSVLPMPPNSANRPPLPTDGSVAPSTTIAATGSLDAPNNSNPSVTVNAANPTDVKFTVSDLQNGEHGTITFTDAKGIQDVVSIGGNGTYSTNLSNLANGQITYLLSVTDAAGDIINVDPVVILGPTGYYDGSANAPSGAPQYSTLLSSYAAQPPWQVAGVDYAVGPQPGVALKDPTTINMPGVSLVTSGANHWIYITGNNVTLNGYDFTLDGGWTLVIEGQNDTISNFKIGVVSGSASPPIQMPFGSGANNTTIEHGTIDGGGAASSNLAGGCGIVDNSGLLTLQYCWIKNFTEGGVALGTTTSSLIQYNLFDSAKFDDNFHSQFINAPQGASNTVVQYNTFYQPAAASDGFPGFMVAALNDAGYANNANISGVVFNNNVGVGIGATGHVAGSPTDSSDAMEDWVNFTNSQNGTALNINPIAEDNYVTMSGTLHGFAYPLNGTVVTPTLANNVNMETGAQLTSVNVPSPPTVT